MKGEEAVEGAANEKEISEEKEKKEGASTQHQKKGWAVDEEKDLSATEGESDDEENTTGMEQYPYATASSSIFDPHYEVKSLKIVDRNDPLPGQVAQQQGSKQKQKVKRSKLSKKKTEKNSGTTQLVSGVVSFNSTSSRGKTQQQKTAGTGKTQSKTLLTLDDLRGCITTPNKEKDEKAEPSTQSKASQQKNKC